MKRFLFGALLIFLSLHLSAQTFRVFIVQDSLRKEVGFSDSAIELNKRPFVIEVHLLDSLEGVSVSISFDSTYYKTPREEPLYDWNIISAKTMVEQNFNGDHSLLADEERVCYWFYKENATWHRFDKEIKKLENGFRCTKTVEKIDDLGADNTIAVKNINRPLFLVFFSSKQAKGRIETELERKKTALIFK